MSEHSVRKIGEPEKVPVFNCAVLVGRSSDGAVRARVANLAGLEVTADSERAALQQLIPRFKTAVSEYLQRGEEIPWLEPPADAAPGEQSRWIAVHL